MFRDRSFLARDLVAILNGAGFDEIEEAEAREDLREALRDIAAGPAGRPDARKIGLFLRGVKDRWVEGQCLRAVGDLKTAQTWRVEKSARG